MMEFHSKIGNLKCEGVKIQDVICTDVFFPVRIKCPIVFSVKSGQTIAAGMISRSEGKVILD
jgi:hypothetical protein